MNTSPGLTPDPLPDHVSEELESLRKKINSAHVMLAEWTAFVDKLNSEDGSVYHHSGWIKYRIHRIQSALKGDQ